MKREGRGVLKTSSGDYFFLSLIEKNNICLWVTLSIVSCSIFVQSKKEKKAHSKEMLKIFIILFESAKKKHVSERNVWQGRLWERERERESVCVCVWQDRVEFDKSSLSNIWMWKSGGTVVYAHSILCTFSITCWINSHSSIPLSYLWFL